MCEFRQCYPIGTEDGVIKIYRVMGFYREDEYNWWFWVKPTKLIYLGGEKEIDEPPKLWAYPKRKKVGMTADRRPVFEQMEPPSFYQKLYKKSKRRSKKLKKIEASSLGALKKDRQDGFRY